MWLPALATVLLGISELAAGGQEGQGIAIRFAPAAGQRYYIKTVVQQDVTRLYMGAEEKGWYCQGFGEELEVLRVEDDGSRTIRSTYRWIKYERQGVGGELVYDSSKADEPVPNDCLGYAAMIGEGFVFKVAGDGGISGLAGLKAMAQRIRAKLPAGELGDEFMREVRRYVDDKTVKEMLETGFGLYPDQPVAVGGSWSTRVEQFQEGGGIRQSQLTLEKAEDGVGEISIRSLFSPNPKAEPVDWGDVRARFELTGTEQGRIRLDLETGIGLGTKLEHELTGYVVLVNPERPTQEVPIAMTVKGTTAIEVGRYEQQEQVERDVEQYVLNKSSRRRVVHVDQRLVGR